MRQAQAAVNQWRFDHMVRALYLSGHSTYTLANKLGTSQGSIGRSLRRSNTPRRTIKQARLLQLGRAA